MARYAVKLGEIQLRSHKPITMEERAHAIAELTRAYKNALLITQGGLEVGYSVAADKSAKAI